MSKFIYSDTIPFRMIISATGDIRLVQKNGFAFITVTSREALTLTTEESIIEVYECKRDFIDLNLTPEQIMSLFKPDVVGIED